MYVVNAKQDIKNPNSVLVKCPYSKLINFLAGNCNGNLSNYKRAALFVHLNKLQYGICGFTKSEHRKKV